ncbi:CHAT domain-containing protein [Streptomyces sp. B6B3]|uniref:CHAT domain-containing protein n=1 Tax=Streptomyces sp. B6B3 TaxID=3153570 RepID=UPI00325E3604
MSDQSGDGRTDGQGGVAGIRAWVASAVGQADALLRGSSGGGEGHDQVVDHLTRIQALLPEDDPARAKVVPRLGLLLAHRCYTGRARPPERETALRHLRWTHRYGDTGDPLAIRARLLLIPMLRSKPADGSGLDGMLREAALAGGDGTLKSMVLRQMEEISDVIDSLRTVTLPPHLRKQLDRIQRFVTRLTPGEGEAVEDTLTDLVEQLPGGGDPGLRALVRLVRGGSGPDAARELVGQGVTDPDAVRLGGLLARLRGAALREDASPDATPAVLESLDELLRILPESTPARAEWATLRARLLLAFEAEAPGSAGWAAAGAAAAVDLASDDSPVPDWPGRAAQERGLAAYGDMMRAARQGDPELLERAAARLRETIHTLPEESREARTARADLARLLTQATLLSGSLQDADAAVAQTRALVERLDREGRDARPDDAFMNMQATVTGALEELELARRQGDPSALSRVFGDVQELYESLPADHAWRHLVAGTLGTAHATQAQGRQGQDRAVHIRQAKRYLREAAAEHAPQALAAYLPFTRAVLLAQLTGLEPDREAIDEAITAIRQALDGPQIVHRQEATLRHALGQVLLRAATMDQDHALLNEGMAELERARDLTAQRRGTGALTTLSASYVLRSLVGRERGASGADRVAGRDADVTAALAASREALAELAADVLLQLGAEHGLATARSGAAHALGAAGWAAHHGRAAESVEALELSRALVLRAAAASRDVPGLLAERGHPELAEEWRGAVPGDPLRPGAAEAFLRRADGQSGPMLPSALRRRALEALDVREMLAVPGSRELTAGLAAGGVDALVYLLPGANEGATGHALLLCPGQDAPRILPLPRLTLTSPVLRRYLDAAARRHEAEEEWQAALGELCAWAWPAAMGPVLEASTQGPGSVPRIVLVPCGPLGVVAWHAARVGDGRGWRYACQEALISYAPSGGELLRAVARRRLPVDGGQVLVSDPSLTLVWSEIEAETLRAAYYPDALRYGEFPFASDADDPPDAAGTVADLLAVLPGGENGAEQGGGDSGGGRSPAVIHVACHAVAGPRPTLSALQLAGDEAPLTVARILDGAAGLPPDAAGPLVVLSACETDLSTRDHDEALTLVTALVARGAVDVVGSRWAVRDGATAVMMAVFHHFVAVDSRAPADALREAQLWMLNPERRPPPALHGPLLVEADRRDLQEVHNWAAFTHQGSPAPAAALRPRSVQG